MDKAIFTRRDAFEVNHRPLAQKDSVRYGHDLAFHIDLQLCDQLNAVHKEFGEEVALLDADKMQFEAVEPSHRALAAQGKPFEHLVDMDSLIPADTQCRAVPRILPIGHVSFVGESVNLNESVIKLAEIIGHKENISSFVSVDRQSERVCYWNFALPDL